MAEAPVTFAISLKGSTPENKAWKDAIIKVENNLVYFSKSATVRLHARFLNEPLFRAACPI
jgi:hypothetical protein